MRKRVPKTVQGIRWWLLACLAAAGFLAFGTARPACLASSAALWATAISGDPVPEEEEKYRIEIIDAKAFDPTMAGTLQLPTDSPGISTMAYRTGVTADGLSVLVIRLGPIDAEPFPITFTVSDSAGDPASVVGALSSTMPAVPAPLGGSTGTKTSVTIPAGQSPVVYYCPPEAFKFGGVRDNTAIGEQNQKLTITASTGGEALAAAPLYLVRPTILFVHGVLSGPGTWTGSQDSFTSFIANVNLPSAQYSLADYSFENTSGYDLTAMVVPTDINDLVGNEVASLIATTRVDVVGHSMGGVITAWYASNFGDVTISRNDGFPNGSWNGKLFPFRSPNDFGVGDIRRFVSIGSPFNGSPLADALVGAFSAQAFLTAIDLQTASATGNGAAVYDLQIKSSASSKLETQPGPSLEWLPIAGIAGQGQNLGLPDSALYTIGGWIPGQLAGLPQNGSDLIVAEVSAVNSVSAPVGEKITKATGVVHTTETTDLTIQQDVAQALDFQNAGGSVLFNTQF